jgi:hypothetical protein
VAARSPACDTSTLKRGFDESPLAAGLDGLTHPASRKVVEFLC